ncbi:MAG: GNAT family N-acetyltransferase [Vampirovibrio sp.]|nr:GNAT family N-acetyltransferase [Vampirovibrio sp.]
MALASSSLNNALVSQVSSIQNNYATQVVSSVEGLEELIPEWTALTHLLGTTQINLDPCWLLTWLEHFPPEKLFIITVRDSQDQLLGLAPLKLDKGKTGVFNRLVRYLEFIGTQPSLYDEIQFLIHPKASQQQVIQEIAQAIQSHASQWDILNLPFVSNQQQLQSLAEALKGIDTNESMGVTIEETMSTFSFELPETIDAYETNGKKNRRKLREYTNKMNRYFPDDPLDLTVYESQEGLFEDFQAFVFRHIEYWQENGVKSPFKRYPVLKDFYLDLFERYARSSQPFHMQFSVLKAGEKIMGYDLGICQRGTYLTQIPCYRAEFRRYSPGFLLTEGLIRRAIDKGLSSYSFGRGNEPYKAQWCQEGQPLWNLAYTQTSIGSFCVEIDTQLKRIFRLTESKI